MLVVHCPISTGLRLRCLLSDNASISGEMLLFYFCIPIAPILCEIVPRMKRLISTAEIGEIFITGTYCPNRISGRVVATGPSFKAICRKDSRTSSIDHLPQLLIRKIWQNLKLEKNRFSHTCRLIYHIDRQIGSNIAHPFDHDVTIPSSK